MLARRPTIRAAVDREARASSGRERDDPRLHTNLHAASRTGQPRFPAPGGKAGRGQTGLSAAQASSGAL